MTDMSTGLYAYGAILAALMVQQRTGKGQKIDCDLLSTQVGRDGWSYRKIYRQVCNGNVNTVGEHSSYIMLSSICLQGLLGWAQ